VRVASTGVRRWGFLQPHPRSDIVSIYSYILDIERLHAILPVTEVPMTDGSCKSLKILLGLA